MAQSTVTEIHARDDVLHIVVKKRALNESSTRELVDDVHTAAVEHLGIPIVLDLSMVKFAPSVALGSLVQLSKSFEFDGRRIALIGVDRNVRDAIRVTHLDKMLEIHDTLEQVVSRSTR